MCNSQLCHPIIHLLDTQTPNQPSTEPLFLPEYENCFDVWQISVFKQYINVSLAEGFDFGLPLKPSKVVTSYNNCTANASLLSIMEQSYKNYTVVYNIHFID